MERKRTYNDALDSTKNQSGNDINAGLPRELTVKFEPLHCKLCDTIATSTVSAAIHYAGKPHRKNINKFLEEWCKRTGEPMPKINKPNELQLRQDPTYCSTCSITLTSAINAKEHYAGKNHAKAVKKKHNNDEADKIPVARAVHDPTGRFGIGVAHLNKEKQEEIVELQKTIETAEEKPNKFVCELCNVRAPTFEQLISHLKGAKHLKTVKKSQVTSSPLPVPPPPPPEPKPAVVESSVSAEYAMHRTPSGNYYCQCCDVGLNSSESFAQHIESKKHKFKQASSRKPYIKYDNASSEK